MDVGDTEIESVILFLCFGPLASGLNAARDFKDIDLLKYPEPLQVGKITEVF
jgi:hypothetical protein